jgi:hypothetical protein
MSRMIITPLHWIHPNTPPLSSSHLRKGRYSLSPRAILELQPYLKSTYPDEIMDCTICFEVSVSANLSSTTKKKKISQRAFRAFSRFRFLPVVARVPEQTATCGCIARAMMRTADPITNVPPAARTGAESEATGPSTSVRQQHPKMSGHAGRGGARRWKKAKTTMNKATRTRTQMRMRMWNPPPPPPPPPLDLLKRLCAVISSEQQALRSEAPSFAKTISSDETFF